jgi:hypothetical protein
MNERLLPEELERIANDLEGYHHPNLNEAIFVLRALAAIDKHTGCPRCLRGVPGFLSDPAFDCTLCDGTGVVR